jgi:hypothetical protein
VLCELEGLSRQDAARRLGIPPGTLSSRLARAKVDLRDRLRRRGYAVPVVALSRIMVREAGQATLPATLTECTVGAAMRVAAGSSAAGIVSASVVSLADGVLKAMLLAKLKAIVLAVGTTAAVVSGSVVLAQVNPTPKRETLPATEDRAAAMERKLDKIIDALDRMTAGSAGGSRVSARESKPKLVNDLSSALDAGALANLAAAERDTVNSLLQAQIARAPGNSAAALRTLRQDTHALPLADRMEAVEGALRAVEQRLEALEGRLAELDKRVGGGGVSNLLLAPNRAKEPDRATTTRSQTGPGPEKPH